MARKPNTKKEKTEAEKTNLETNLEANLEADTVTNAKEEPLKNADEIDRTLGNDEPDEDGQVIYPTAYAITLRSIHPQSSYGRCGYRFNKERAVEIPAEHLTGEQVVILAEDPWLEFVPICDE